MFITFYTLMTKLNKSRKALYIGVLLGVFAGVGGILAFVQAQVPGYSVSFASPTVAPQGTIVVNWTAPADRTSRSDWIGLFPVGATDRQYVTYEYIPNGQSSGTVTFPARQQGAFEVRLFPNNDYVRAATSPAPVTVGASQTPPPDPADPAEPPASGGGFSVSTDRSSYGVGDTVMVNWTAPADRTSRGDWIGLYRVGASDRQYVTYEYMPNGQSSGTVSFSVRTAGDYEVRVYRNGGYERVSGATATFAVGTTTTPPTDPADPADPPANGGGFSVSTDRSSYAIGDTVRVNWTAPADRTTRNDWIGLYRAGSTDRQYVTWEYIPNGQSSGTVTFQARTAGNYEVRVYRSNGYDRVSGATATFTVGTTTTPPTDPNDPPTDPGTSGYRLTVAQMNVPIGSTVTVAWNAPAGVNLSNDWIGLYRPGEGDRSYLTYRYVSGGGTSGTVTFTINTAGTYEFRYFKNNSYERVATSPRLTVDAATLPACPVTDVNAITNFPPRTGPIVAVGDSLTAGVGASSGQDYVSQLSRRANVPIINAGVSGDTTEDVLARLERDVLARDPSVVLVWVGGNDILQRYYDRIQQGAENPSLLEAIRVILLRISGKLPEPSGITEDETFENLRTIVQRAQADGAVVILLGFSGGVFDTGLETRYRQVALQTGAIYVPNVMNGIIGRPALMSDLVHPNNTGYGMVAERVYPYLGCTL